MKTVAKVWEFPSKSNPTHHHQTLQYTDGTTSCDCMAWTRRCPDGTDASRTCPHVRMIAMGTADREAAASHDYTKSGVKKTEVKADVSSATARKKDNLTVIPTRRILIHKAPA